MPVYNGEHYLREAVESVLKQTYSGFGLIMVNDGSTDATSAIFDEYGNSRIARVKNKENIGLTRSLNKGLVRAGGEQITHTDADSGSGTRTCVLAQ